MAALSSLTNRIFLASTLLASVSIGAGVYFVSDRMRAEAEAELQRDLAEAATLVDQQRATMFENFARTARLIADLPKFKAVIETGDAPTVAPIAADYQQQAGADLFLVTDPRGSVLAAIGTSPALSHRLDEIPRVDAAKASALTTAFWPHPRGVLQVVSVPVTIGLDRPEVLGILTVGYLLDDERAAVFKALTGADIAFAMNGQVRSSTFGPEAQPQLAALLSADMVPRINVGDSEYAALVRPLPALDAAAAEAAVPMVIVLRSRTARMRTLSAIQRGLGVVAALTILLAIAVSYGVARTITRPLARITDHMRQVAATGDLTRKIPVAGSPGWHDEDARLLATTFNTLTDSIARFQREAAQRERLSSLGRMSTIVAHEIRNPLMIIKGALRQVTRGGASAADIRDASADIDGEIERLNRVVNEVLDFARPIRFDPAPTDINALCRAAASAVTAAGEPEPQIALDLDPTVPMLDTDAERIRTVLVNLLTNARHAVVARNGSSPGDAPLPPVTLSSARLGERRVAIDVRDKGVGITPDDLPRIFDPYFTTRRAGTGLGLPIARNIIDGLGGTITVTSLPGAGTTIHVELSDAPARNA